MTTIRSSDLDFNEIKESLKTYLQQSGEFTDYDFEASGISNILDVLAYNTHVNGLLSNFAINESFITSAQLRPSVVSHAEALGYFPRSKTASFAVLNVSVNSESTTLQPTVILPAKTQFTTSVNDVTYTFQTLEEYNAIVDDNGVYTFKNSTGLSDILVYEGEIKTKTFLVGEKLDDQVYVIPDPNIDTSTLTIKVYDTPTSSSFTTYTNISRVARVTNTSTVFIVREVPNGYYEITFSDGNVLGLAPVAGNKIVMEYIASNGPNANGATTFTPVTTISFSDTTFNLSVVTSGVSSGGSERETISSVKLNAPLSFASQQRLVTAEDYRASILSKYSGTVADVIAWGGNDNVPPQYGNVFVSLQFYDDISPGIQQQIKDSIVNDLAANLAIMSIDTVFADPEITYLELGTTFNYNPDLTGETARTIEASVVGQIAQYFNDNLKQFAKIFRRSNLLSSIDDLSPAILNSKMTVKMQQRFVPSTTASLAYNIFFPAAIAAPDDVEHTIETTNFTYANQVAKIRNVLGSNKLNVVTPQGEILKDNVGEYDEESGTVTIIAFQPSAFIGSAIKVSVLPANQSTVKPLRNYILDIDQSRSFAQAVPDYQEVRVKL